IYVSESRAFSKTVKFVGVEFRTFSISKAPVRWRVSIVRCSPPGSPGHSLERNSPIFVASPLLKAVSQPSNCLATDVSGSPAEICAPRFGARSSNKNIEEPRSTSVRVRMARLDGCSRVSLAGSDGRAARQLASAVVRHRVVFFSGAQRRNTELLPIVAALVHLVKRQVPRLHNVIAVFRCRGLIEIGQHIGIARPRPDAKIARARLVVSIAEAAPDAGAVEYVLLQHAGRVVGQNAAHHALPGRKFAHQFDNLRFHPIDAPGVLPQEREKYRRNSPGGRQMPFPRA